MSHYENLFSSQQFGFRPHLRTTDSLFILKTVISKYVLKKKTKIFSCFVDLRKAFDTVWHNGLLHKLMKNKIGHKFFNIFQNMYSLCQSAVKIDNKHSNYFNLEKGVKQGDSHQSCNPLKLDHTLVSSLSFADDLVIFSESHKELQNALYKLQKYCFDWQLTVNINKTKILTFLKTFHLSPCFFIIINHSQKLKNTIFSELSLNIRVVSKGEYKNCQKRV